MSTETETSHYLPFENANWGSVRAALSLLALAQLLLLSIYLEYAPGYFITSLALGSAASYFLMTLTRPRKALAMTGVPDAEKTDHIGSIALWKGWVAPSKIV
jgi:hypothetical protein